MYVRVAGVARAGGPEGGGGGVRDLPIGQGGPARADQHAAGSVAAASFKSTLRTSCFTSAAHARQIRPSEVSEYGKGEGGVLMWAGAGALQEEVEANISKYL